MSNLTIRLAQAADAAAALAIYAPYVEETAVTFAYTPPTVEAFAEKIEHTLARHPFIVAELDGAVVGYAYASPFYGREAYNWDCEMSIYVQKDLRTKGIGRALYGAMEMLLRRQGIFNLYACIAEMRQEKDDHLTHDSQKFHQKMGYETVARFDDCGYKFDRWYDIIWMQKRLIDPVPTPPPAFVPFGELAHSLTEMPLYTII